MTLWDDLIPQVTRIADEFEKNIKDTLSIGLAALDEFEKDCLSTHPHDKNSSKLQVLQSINEDEVEVTPPKSATSEPIQIDSSGQKTKTQQETQDAERATSKKRGKDELGNNTPEQDKRPKRGASVRAQAVINQQVNVNLTAKLRRPGDSQDDKENRPTNIPPVVKVKQEKISLVLPAEESAECGVPPIAADAPVKTETDAEIMPPPVVAPAPKSRRNARKKTDSELEQSAAQTESRRSTRTRKQTSHAPLPPPPSERRTRASSRQASQEEEMPPPPPPQDTRPKRTRARKNQKQDSETASESEPEKPKEPVIDANEKPRPKRTRRGKKASEPKIEEPKTEQPGSTTPPRSLTKELLRGEKKPLSSPVISVPAKKVKTSLEKQSSKEKRREDEAKQHEEAQREEAHQVSELDETRVLSRDTIDKVADTTDNGDVDAGKPATPGESHSKEQMNDTVVLSKNPAMNETVVLSSIAVSQLTNDSSLMTSDGNDEIEDTPPRSMIPVKQPTSAVKQRVQQFEQMANGGNRLTRNKTRALSKQNSEPDNVTPPNDRIYPVSASKLILPTSKPLTQSQSATKPRSNIVTAVKSFLPASATKPTATRQEDKAASRMEREREMEDARRKKEAMLEAKREDQRRRREQKMAAAAAVRDAQARERRLQLEAKAAGWQEKQAHVDQGKMEKLKEAERKRQALEKKAAEMEERRRAEEAARVARLEEEQRRAEAARKRQQEEAERVRREEARNEREMALARAEYLKKQEQKKLEQLHAPMSSGTSPAMAPVHMADGFQYLNSDSEDDERPKIAVPEWSRSKPRLTRLRIQEQIPTLHIDALFSVQRHTPDLTVLFPAIDRRVLKRTSSAVWRTPPRLVAHAEE